MVLVGFTENMHVLPIIEGKKAQTTRIIKKRKYHTGDTLHLYFKSRMKKSCKNCIRKDCPRSVYCGSYLMGGLCDAEIGFHHHNNFFGKARVNFLGTHPEGLENWSIAEKETWAVLDGFKNFEDANKWFTEKYGGEWQKQPIYVIGFRGSWL